MHTYAKLDRMLDQYPHLDRRKLANNTYAYRKEDDSIGIILHATEIIIVRQDGTYVLNSGGWRTYTTKDRINRFTPARVYQHNHVWYVGYEDTPFFDGMIVDQHGAITNASEDDASSAVDDEKHLKKMIDRMIRSLKKLDELPQPSNGDCWGCLMKTENNEYPMGQDCVWSHLEENYIHGSLIYRALLHAGYNESGIGIHWHGWKRSHNAFSREIIINAMRRFLRFQGQRIIYMRRQFNHEVASQR